MYISDTNDTFSVEKIPYKGDDNTLKLLIASIDYLTNPTNKSKKSESIQKFIETVQTPYDKGTTGAIGGRIRKFLYILLNVLVKEYGKISNREIFRIAWIVYKETTKNIQTIKLGAKIIGYNIKDIFIKIYRKLCILDDVECSNLPQYVIDDLSSTRESHISKETQDFINKYGIENTLLDEPEIATDRDERRKALKSGSKQRANRRQKNNY